MQPRRGRPQKRELVVGETQRAELERLAQQSRRSRSVAFRARIVLDCSRGLSNAAVAAKLRTTGFTVGFWRNRFIAEGIAGLGDEPRPGAPRQIGDDKIEQVVRLTLERDSQRSHPLVESRIGSAQRVEPVDDQSHLASFWSETASYGELPAFYRSAVDRQGARYRGTVLESAAECIGTLRR